MVSDRDSTFLLPIDLEQNLKTCRTTKGHDHHCLANGMTIGGSHGWERRAACLCPLPRWSPTHSKACSHARPRRCRRSSGATTGGRRERRPARASRIFLRTCCLTFDRTRSFDVPNLEGLRQLTGSGQQQTVSGVLGAIVRKASRYLICHLGKRENLKRPILLGCRSLSKRSCRLAS